MGVLEAIRVRQDPPVGELLGRLALTRRGGRETVEHALRIGIGAAGEEPEAVEPRREIVEQQARARTLGRRLPVRRVLSALAGNGRGS
jgi:hypothetical protein